ncbi:hypothetical protein CYMTET_39135 [Cymbomonas tetramitiformis]|uniref:Guanylate cyclase n=1 Tax=Cymbomonas tetramitiformis TaxID=36881 RepID=A0AAE0F4Y1_9CHLO|nr:hypothetical protein CYMTET_39135 [Cymbomonas tetramitiformis]
MSKLISPALLWAGAPRPNRTREASTANSDRSSNNCSEIDKPISSKKKQDGKQVSRLWLDKGRFWDQIQPLDEELENASCLSRSVENAWWELKAAKQVLKEHPKIAIAPTTSTIVFLVVALIGVFVVAHSTETSEQEQLDEELALSQLLYAKEEIIIQDEYLRTKASTDEMATALVDGLERAYAPLKMLELYVRQNPVYPYIEDNFPAIAADVMDVADLPGKAYTLGIAPFAVVADKYPFGNNAGAIGHDNLNHCQVVPDEKMEATNNGTDCSPECGLPSETRCYPSRRAITYLSVETRMLTLDGPVTLVQGGYAFIMRHPIFVNVSADPFGVGQYNETFGRSYAAHNCTAPVCYNETSGLRYWGQADSLLSFQRWLDLAQLDLFTQNKIAYRIIDPVKDMVLTSVGSISNEPITKNIIAYNRVLKLETSPDGGWMEHSTAYGSEVANAETPVWRDPLLVSVAIIALYLGAILTMMVVNKRRHKKLLQSMLPTKTLPYIERGRNFCEQFSTITVLFSDIVSYTSMAAEMSPLEVVNMLNELYFLYDKLAEKHGVYKVETIGDAFMCAGGVPDECSPLEGACAIADMGLDMIEATRSFVTSGGLKIQIRVGMHSGPAVAAVVGLKMPHYCLFGDTVNTASRMESNSEAMRVHLSGSTHAILQANETKKYNLTPRGEMNIKGKGKMYTYWLDSPDHLQSFPLLQESAAI